MERNFDWALGINRLGSRLLGIWPTSDNSNQHRNFRHLATLLHVPFMMSIMFFGVFLPQAWGLVLIMKQLPLVIENFLTSCPALASCFGLYFLWSNRKDLKLVTDSAEQDWLDLKKHQQQPSWHAEIMYKQAARARFITVIDHAVILFSFIGFVFLPLINFPLRTFTNVTDCESRKFLLQSYYPYNYCKSPQFELTQASQHVAGFFVTICSSIPENFFGALVFHNSAQFEVLAIKFKRIFDNEDDDRRNFAWKLKTLVDRHVHLMTMMTIIENSFTYVMLAQIACTSVMICSAGFQMIGMLGGGENEPSPLQIVTLIGIICTMMFHTLLECFASEVLATKSQMVFEGVCNCNWYDEMSIRSAQCLIPILRVAKTTRPLTAGKILNLSLPAFCTILKTTAGYISMLVAVTTR